MTSAASRILLDASVLIALVDAGDAHHEWSERLIAAKAPVRLAASALTLAEALVRPSVLRRGAEVKADLDRFGIEAIGIAEADALPLAEIRATTRLRMPDVVVLFAAEQTASALATTDAQLARVAAGRGLVVHAPPG